MKALSLLLLAFFLYGGFAHAETPKTPQLIFTWEALNFFPSDYQGKALATPHTPVRVGLMATQNNKVVDLSAIPLRWYMDDTFLGEGLGLVNKTVTIKKSPGDSHYVRVTFPWNGAQTQGGVRIPIGNFLTVIETPVANTAVYGEQNLSLNAIPYFFNISSLSDLVFSWQVNDTKYYDQKTNTLSLHISAPNPGETRTVQASTIVQNKKNPLEFTKESIKFTAQ